MAAVAEPWQDLKAGSPEKCYWDPAAEAVWLACRRSSPRERSLLYPLQRRDVGSGIWRLPASSAVQRQEAYAFLSEWTQQVTLNCGGPWNSVVRVTRWPYCEQSCLPADVLLPPEEEAEPEDGDEAEEEEGLAATAAAVARQLQIGGATSSGKKPPPEPEDPIVAAAKAAEQEWTQFASQLQGSELVVIVDRPHQRQPIPPEAADADTGDRVIVVVAHWLPVASLEVAMSPVATGYSADGVAEPVVEVMTALPMPPGCAEAAAPDVRPPPSIWMAEYPSSRRPVEGEWRLELRLKRRDWRMDPFAFRVERGGSRRKPDDDVEVHAFRDSASGATIMAPAEPFVWSVPVSISPRPGASFQRCSDRELVLYEMHVGSFTAEGTLAAATARLEHVRQIGCTGISIMPVQQDLRRLETSETDWWGYDVMSLVAVDSVLGSPEDLASFVHRAHELELAVFVDYVANHMIYGADALLGPQLFAGQHATQWGPRPDFALPQVRHYCLTAAEVYLQTFGFDGLRVDSTKSMRKFPNHSPDPDGALFLHELSSLCRRHDRLCIAEDLEDGDGILQYGGLGFHLQWDMAMFCMVYDALVTPWDENRDLSQVIRGLNGMAPGRSHPLRGRVLFMESHDTAPSDRYGRLPAAVHNGRPFMGGNHGEGGDAFQSAEGEALPYPAEEDSLRNPFAARRSAIGVLLVMTAPGIPMLLQGQELCDCRPFQWPRGPAIDWKRVAETATDVAGKPTVGLPSRWRRFCQDAIRLRSRRGHEGQASRLPPPLMGDSMQVLFNHGGIFAFLRWAEPEDSREAMDDVPGEFALVVVNLTNNCYPSFLVGVPASSLWRLALTSAVVAETDEASTVRAQHEAMIPVLRKHSNHGFPCSIDVPLQEYSATVLFCEE
eukprot:TRINITY_DN41337_c0_g1_i1.p1 TRINITY_DN41337_c0_g1~~TRINITY_DN41337_c0_g1_i1.p1  ORF type:complete len:891 (-),score=150.95 TRINITY_DN41337_c0_g1_i1:249-2921(-)